MAETKSRVTAILVTVIILLALVLLYALVIRPGINGYAVAQQNQGVVMAVNSILSQVQQSGMVQIPIGNQTLVLYAQNVIPQLCAQLNNSTK